MAGGRGNAFAKQSTLRPWTPRNAGGASSAPGAVEEPGHSACAEDQLWPSGRSGFLSERRTGL